jgi:hypothetical protein
MDKNTGKLREKVVTILERHLDPDASVTCDEKLPVLSSPHRSRQIDVLIETGKGSRKTFTIVETQDRVDKPVETEFDGWLKKMRQVGAQHLICVTRAGYPSSILERAQEIGPTVRLYTLSQFEESNSSIFPPSLVADSILQVVRYGKIHGLQVKIDKPHLVRMHPDLHPDKGFDPDYPCFLPRGHHQAVSTSDVADWHFFRNPKNLQQLPHTGDFVTVEMRYDKTAFADNTHLFEYKGGAGWEPIEYLRIQMDIAVENKPMKWEESHYESINKGSEGWILRGRATYDDKALEVYVPIRVEDNGLYMAGSAVSLSDGDEFFTAIGDVGYKGKVFKRSTEN